MKKLVNGALVDRDADEIAARDAEISRKRGLKIARHLRIYRDRRVYEGVTVGGVRIGTDDRTQMRLMAARVMAAEDADYSVNWKAESGFVTLDAEAVIALADAVRAHVQKCFDAEEAIAGAVFVSFETLEGAFDNAYDAA